MDGYHHTDEQLTEHDDGDWKSVGDVAYLDDEGYLYICDRKKDMIISGGVNIYPAEIEAVLHEHPQVLDVAVFGIPDDEWGERVHAIVQPRAGRDARPRRAARVRRASGSAATSGRATTRCATSCRAPSRASCSSACCATSTGATARPRSEPPDGLDALRARSPWQLRRPLRRAPVARRARADDPDDAVARRRQRSATRWW